MVLTGSALSLALGVLYGGGARVPRERDAAAVGPLGHAHVDAAARRRAEWCSPRQRSGTVHRATCNVQRATCNVQRATCNVQRAT